MKYNRIKVADLEKNQPNKLLTTNDDGELKFSDINDIKVSIYDALDYSTAGMSLDARQGKILKDLIDTINIVLASDNFNLSTIQKLADAIEELQNSLNTNLINDLTSGGVTKALTAEMGKVLQNNKVDKLTGKGLSTEDYSSAEKAKLVYIDQTKDIEKPISTAQLAALASKQDIVNQVEVSTSQIAQSSWHGKTVFFKTNVTITIPASGLPPGYTFEGATLPGCTLTWTIAAPKAWAMGAPPTIAEKSIFTLMQQMSDSNNIYLFGV
ncbi:hypothetical protein [Flavobacterium sp. Root420]|uniref:hypothetical protein n=1 Tax=Flavobacterium sp. Root420 TaxID=1736533 RepID=UPI0006FD7C58|nr:hypothetical protein [Flavobacterium sp. Root420]KQX15321.1 hypothetical protein ASC72_00115 [Flavobacterium sp. Root420]